MKPFENGPEALKWIKAHAEQRPTSARVQRYQITYYKLAGVNPWLCCLAEFWRPLPQHGMTQPVVAA